MNITAKHVNQLIRVLIVDDEWVIREGLRTFLKSDPQILIVGEATNGSEAIEMTLRLDPSIVIMDTIMPILDGLSATQQIKKKRRSIGIIILALEDEIDSVSLAVKYGAAGYLFKNITATELIEAVKQAYRGKIQLHPLALQRLSQHTSFIKNWNGLTPREVEIARLVSQGLTNHQIAEQLQVRPSTIKVHIGNILEKLGISSRLQVLLHIEQLSEGVSPPHNYPIRLST